jgi:hypothetical protein
MKGAAAQLDLIAKRAAIAGVALGSAMNGFAAALGIAVKSSINQADALDKLAQSSGVPIEQLSQLKFAAEISGVSIEALGKSLAVLSKNMSDAATNAKGEAARAFAAMGISVKDASGHLKNAQQVLDEVATKFKGYQDGAAKSALATAIFGRAGASLIPLLNEGADGIQRMMQQANQLGITIDEKTGKAASQFNDNLTVMSKLWDAIAIQISANLLPAFLNLSTKLSDVAKNGDIARGVAEAIGSALSKVTEIVMTTITGWQRLGAEWNALREFLKTDIFSGKLTENWNKFLETGRETRLVMAQLHASFEDDPLGTFADDVVLAGTKVAKGAAPIISSTRSSTEAIDSFLSRMSTQSAKMQASAEALTMTTAEAKAYEMEQQAITLGTEKQIPLTDQLMQRIFDAATAYGQIAEATERAKAKFNELNQIGQQVGGAIGNVFQDWITKGGKFGDVLKSLASKLANIAFQAMVTKPLQNIFGNLFSGGQKPIFAASGANFTVPGTGGLDSVFTPMMLTPGENVSVTPKGGSKYGGAPQVKYEFNFAPGMSPGDMARVQIQVKQAIAQSEAGTISRIRRAHQTDSAFLNG